MSLSPCRFSVLSVLVILLVGCAAPLSITLPRAASDTSCTAAAPDADLLVGLALSGGGSRAALFGQAGLEALANLPAPGGGSVLERVMYVSSVSGGGLPAAYFAKKLQDKKARRGLIITFDSSFPFDVGERRLSLRAQPFSLLTYDFSRIPSIMEERAGTYAAFFWRSLQLEGVFPDNDTMRIVVLRHTDAQWRDDLSDLPEACRREEPRLESAADVVERLAEIPTRFYVASACDRELLAVSAAKVVQQNREYILELLATRLAPGR